MNWDAYWGLSIVEAERQRALEQDLTFAAELCADLARLAETLIAASERLASAHDYRSPMLASLDVSFFHRNRSALNRLPAENASMVRRAYDVVTELRDRYARRSDTSAAQNDQAGEVRVQLATAVENIRLAIQGMADARSMSAER